jgi:phosphoglycolate phosphatase
MNQNNSLRVIIFDCDGVMFDSRQANINFYNHLLARFDQPPMDPKRSTMCTWPRARFREAYFQENAPF